MASAKVKTLLTPLVEVAEEGTAILLLRLYALYRRNRGAKIFLTVIWIGAMTSAVCVLGPSLAATKSE